MTLSKHKYESCPWLNIFGLYFDFQFYDYDQNTVFILSNISFLQIGATSFQPEPEDELDMWEV